MPLTPLIALFLAWLADEQTGDPPASPLSEDMDGSPWADLLYRVLMEQGPAHIDGYMLHGPWPLSQLIVTDFWAPGYPDQIGLKINWILGAGREPSGRPVRGLDRSPHGAWQLVEDAVRELAQRSGKSFLLVGDTAWPPVARLWRQLGHDVLSEDEVWELFQEGPEEDRIYISKEIDSQVPLLPLSLDKPGVKPFGCPTRILATGTRLYHGGVAGQPLEDPSFFYLEKEKAEAHARSIAYRGDVVVKTFLSGRPRTMMDEAEVQRQKLRRDFKPIGPGIPGLIRGLCERGYDGVFDTSHDGQVIVCDTQDFFLLSP